MRLNCEVDDEWMVAIAHNNLGDATREQGELETAAYHLGQSLAGYQRFADQWALAEGDSDPVGVRRSKAIGILAQPAQALALGRGCRRSG
jgi:hypothetical protein